MLLVFTSVEDNCQRLWYMYLAPRRYMYVHVLNNDILISTVCNTGSLKFTPISRPEFVDFDNLPSV